MKIPRAEVRCEVLIIGGGLAALVAALEAKKLVDEVVIVSKSKVGRSGNTIVSQCKFGAYIGFDTPLSTQPNPHEGSSDSAQQHCRDTLIGGSFINDEKLVSILASQAGQRLLELENYGVRFQKTNDDFLRESGPGHSCPRTISTCSDYPYAVLGLSITLPPLREARSSGVRLIDDVPIARLLLHNGMVCGATGLDVQRERVLFLHAKAVILDSGGGGQLFALTDNTRDVTGDSYALALEAGATLRDMEFVQFYPLIMTSPVRALIPTLIFSDGAVLRNGAGERFLFGYDERGEMATRDVMSRALFQEMQRGESIYMGRIYRESCPFVGTYPPPSPSLGGRGEWLRSEVATMARLYEYQGKQLLKAAGVPVPEGDVASTPQEARAIAEQIGRPVAIKAQIWATGRLKAGGIKFADDPTGAEKAAAELLGTEVKGFPVEKVLVEEKLDVEHEYYAGVIVDDSYRVKGPAVIFSTEGGVDIEEVAEISPEKISRLNVNILRGLRLYDACNLALAVGVKGALLDPIGRAILGTYELFRKCDARSAEVNPLVLTTDGKVYAADCRVSVDDASVVRHPELGIAVPRESDSPPTEFDCMAWKIEEDDYRGVCFLVQMAPDTEKGGYIGYHAIGGGGALLAADTLVRHGLKLANYADTSGNPTAAKVYRCAKLILSQPGLEGYCLLGAVIASQYQWHHAHGLVKAFREELADRPGFPVVILIAGNKEEEALEILREGLRDLPIRLELYGREYIHKLDFVAERMKASVEEYQARG